MKNKVELSERGVYMAPVFIMNANGEMRTALTNPFGFYRFYGVSVGETYNFRVQHKSYQFTPQSVTVTEEILIQQFGLATDQPVTNAFVL